MVVSAAHIGFSCLKKTSKNLMRYVVKHS